MLVCMCARASMCVWVCARARTRKQEPTEDLALSYICHSQKKVRLISALFIAHPHTIFCGGSLALPLTTASSISEYNIEIQESSRLVCSELWVQSVCIYLQLTPNTTVSNCWIRPFMS